MECSCGGQAKSSSQNRYRLTCNGCGRVHTVQTGYDLFDMPLEPGEYEEAKPFVPWVRDNYPDLCLKNEGSIISMIVNKEIDVPGFRD